MSATFKIIFAENNIRRLKFDSLPSYEEFVAHLKATYPSYFCGGKKFLIKYVDSDNDKIAVETQLEWEELLSHLSGNTLLKIYIEDGTESVEEREESVPLRNYNPFERDVPQFFQAFGNIVRDIPQMTENFIKDIPQMTENFMKKCYDWEEKNRVFEQLHQFSLGCLDSLDKNVIQKGKEAILEMLEIIPNHAVALYNLACAESLLGNAKEAVAALERAVNAGYRDLTHLLNDKDFDNIKNSLGFNEVVATLKRMLHPESPQSNLDQEPVVIDFTQEDKKKEAKVEEKKDPEEEKLDILAEIYPLPRDILQELLTECKGNMQSVSDLISSSFY